jgi:hypothetical protein
MLINPYIIASIIIAETNNNEAIRPIMADDTPMRNYLRHFYDRQIYVPRLQTGEILAKRAVVPFQGGIYGKRSQDSALGDLLGGDHVSVEIRAMPMNGGITWIPSIYIQ